MIPVCTGALRVPDRGSGAVFAAKSGGHSPELGRPASGTGTCFCAYRVPTVCQPLSTAADRVPTVYRPCVDRSELEPARALRTGLLESSPRAVLNVPRWAPKGALHPTRCHRTLRASDHFALSESTGRAQVSTPPAEDAARASASALIAPSP